MPRSRHPLVRPTRAGKRPSLSDRDATPPHHDVAPRGAALLAATDALLDRAAVLQSALYAEGERALLVILQARDTGGKDGTIKHVFGTLNPAGCIIANFREPTAVELRHDYLWRVHQVTPARGMIAVFNRSHYEDVLVTRVRHLVPRSEWRARYQQINDFERMLVANGTTILKLFLHISRREQLARLRARLAQPDKRWKFSPADVDGHEHWNEYTAAYRDAIAECAEAAPWYVVPADKKKVRDFLVAQLLVQELERIDPRPPRPRAALVARLRARL